MRSPHQGAPIPRRRRIALALSALGLAGMLAGGRRPPGTGAPAPEPAPPAGAPASPRGRLARAVRAADRYQRGHRWLAIPLAVRQKHSEDHCGFLAAAITYYAFLSLFPLLLVFTTILGFVLEGHPHLRAQVVDSALGQLPIVGHQIQVRSLEGNGIALGIGLALTLWAGMGVALAAEHAMDEIWDVPHRERPNLVVARARALAVLATVGTGVALATVVAGIASWGAALGPAGTAGAFVLSVALDVAVFWVAFRVLTATPVGWRALLPGAVTAGVLWAALQAFGGLYVERRLQRASAVYGTFGLVIGLLAFLAIGTTITLASAELNAVLTRRLWPRSLSLTGDGERTAADERALRESARSEERRADQRVEVGFTPSSEPDPPDAPR